MFNGGDRGKCWHNSMEVLSLGMFENVFLLEVSVNVHRVPFTFRVFQWEIYSLHGKSLHC
jgi:hypothetical protein